MNFCLAANPLNSPHKARNQFHNCTTAIPYYFLFQMRMGIRRSPNRNNGIHKRSLLPLASTIPAVVSFAQG
jgi:hypothetical protein